MKNTKLGPRLAMLFIAIAIGPSPAAFAQEAPLDVVGLEEDAMKAAVARAAPAVVRIETLGGRQKVDEVLVDAGPTTGLIVSPDGYVLTSAFSFAQTPASILVTLPSGKRAAGKIVARDRSRMLVLLKVQADEPLATLSVAPKDELRVGQWTLALGRSVDSGAAAGPPTVSVGVLSAKERIWGKAVQTDAKISPGNYGGPLIDLRGRAIGILVPLSPTEQGEAAGAEWYDSGIGFAIPLADVLARLERLKAGQDLHPGLLGISLKSADIYADAPVIAAAPTKSPAAKAGLKVGDKIVEIEGQAVTRQAQLKHALGPRYAGDVVRLTAIRGDQRIEAEIELAEKIEPYSHPFLGLLPLREDLTDVKGIGVRYVYPGSPAGKAGVTKEDRLLSIDGKELTTPLAAHELLAAYEPGANVKLALSRGGETREVEVELASLPVEVPSELPSANPNVDPPAEAAVGAAVGPAVGVVQIKLPEEADECIAYVPDNYNAQRPHGLIVWLQAPGSFNRDELVERWREHCRQSQFILLAPQPADKARWSPTEVDFIGKTIDNVIANYAIDRTRIVVHGYQAGGALAYLTAFARRDLVRGVAPIDTAIPLGARPPENDPVQRLAVFTAIAKKATALEAVEAAVDGLRELKFPVTLKKLDQNRYLNDDELAELVRWADSLDRL